jgi:glutamate formiminotransferase/formiminotetrahydrofolate cyclodeaminase
MVANLSSHKAGWDHRWDEFSKWAEKGQSIMNEMLFLVDEDTNSFNKIMEAFGLPKDSDTEKAARSAAIQAATQYATEIPLRTMKVAYSGFDLIEEMVKEGNPNSVSDAGVGALAIRSAIYGAYMNVRINSVDLKDRTVADKLVAEAQEIYDMTAGREKRIIDAVLATLSSK